MVCANVIQQLVINVYSSQNEEGNFQSNIFCPTFLLHLQMYLSQIIRHYLKWLLWFRQYSQLDVSPCQNIHFICCAYDLPGTVLQIRIHSFASFLQKCWEDSSGRVHISGCLWYSCSFHNICLCHFQESYHDPMQLDNYKWTRSIESLSRRGTETYS